MNAIDEAFEKVKNLVTTFKSNETRYESGDYQEAEVRKDFIDKFFTALGWDVNHDVQTNPYEQEVKVERARGTSQRRADYAFHLAPKFLDVRFYVEAKKPHSDLCTPDNYFQAVRYGFSSSNPIVILTNFAQLHILDSRYKPNIGTAIHRGVATYHYSQYAQRDEFAKIYWLFSHEAVAGQSIEKFARELPKTRGKAVQRGLLPGAYKELDESLLDDLDEYRETLARMFKNKNSHLDSQTLTEITQRTLDRLVFLRFLEDKQIETSSVVDDFGRRGSVWEDFVTASRRLDEIYNGIVFKKHDILDSPNFHVDEADFSDVCEKLSHVNSAYYFDNIPIHILGSIYERFLGKVIVVTKNKVKVEEKREVRKAGGVYYTPEYIVRYIVENTIGKLIANKTPQQIAEMQFADIACGSGSFLLGVYDLLLQHHGKYYNQHPGKVRKGDCIERDGELYLSLSKKREILLNNIYGVDVDSQAVEVCQLSLYLKLLKDETTDTTHQYQLEFQRAEHLKRLLPDLTKNIVCGNSLIGTDMLEGQLFAREEEFTLNPMNFGDAFPSMRKRGGFDAVVGNPPWGAEIAPFVREYCKARYRVHTTDTAALFIIQQQRLLRPKGLASYIVPKPLLYNSNWRDIRDAILPELKLVCDCGKVWPEVKLEQIVYLIEKSVSTPTYLSCVRDGQEIRSLGNLDKQLCAEFQFILSNVTLEEIAVARKMKSTELSLSNILTNQRGAMLQSVVKANVGKYLVIGGKQIRRFAASDSFKGRISEQRVTDKGAFVGPNSVLAQNIVAHIENPIDHIEIIATVLPDSLRPKIVILDTVNQLAVKEPWSSEFVLGLINSKLINWFVYRFIYARAIRTMHFDSPVTARIPLPRLSLESEADKQLHDKLSDLVVQAIEAKARWKNTLSDREAVYGTRRLSSLLSHIDSLVYSLYALNDAEIHAVEKGMP